MGSRLEEKQRRRAQREARERERAARDHRSRRLRLTGAAAVGLVLLAVVAVVATGGSRSGSDARAPGAAPAPFGQHYGDLEQRRVAAGVSTMALASASVHAHPHLALWANGRRVTVPANIGIDPRNDSGQMAALHTHDESGTIHDEGQANATLGQFFAVWGVAFSKDRLGPYRAGKDGMVQLWVDGKPSQAWDSLRLADDQDIRITFGPGRDKPPAV